MNVTEREMELKLLSLYIKHTVTLLEIYLSVFYFIDLLIYFFVAWVPMKFITLIIDKSQVFNQELTIS